MASVRRLTRLVPFHFQNKPPLQLPRLPSQSAPNPFRQSSKLFTGIPTALRNQGLAIRTLATQAGSLPTMVKAIRVHELGGPEVFFSLHGCFCCKCVNFNA